MIDLRVRPRQDEITFEKLMRSKQRKVRELWLRGNLKYKLHAGQLLIREKVHSALTQLFVGECARQFGKTFYLVVEALELAFKKPKARIRIGTAFHTDLIEFIIPAFEAVLEDCPEDFQPKFNVQRSTFTVYNNAQIKLVGLDRKPNGLRGNVIDLIILDEAGFMSRLDYIYRSVIMPATTHRPDCKILVFSTPPDTPAHEFIDYVQKAEYEGSYCKLTIYDNPMVDQATIIRLMRESGGPDSTTWRREYLCEHILDANLAIISEWNEKYVQEIKRDDYYPFYHKYVSMDLGVKHKTAALFAYYDFLRASLIIEHEWFANGPDLTTDMIQTEVKAMELELWKGISRSKEKERIEEIWDENRPNVYMRISDNNNPLLLQDLSTLHGINFNATDKGTLEEMTNTVRMMARSGKIIVHPRCKQLTGCLKYGVWDKKRDHFAESKVYGHFDALAALVYLVRNLNRSSNPIPQTFGVDQDNQILFFREHPNATAQALKKAFAL